MIRDNEEAFFRLLSILDKIFKKHDIDYWLEAGSLIGAIREGTYIPWDNDMDISIHHKDIKRVRKLKQEFKQHNVSLNGIMKFGVSTTNASMCILPMRTIKNNSNRYLVQYRYPLCGRINRIAQKLSLRLTRILQEWKSFQLICSKIRKIETIRSPISNLGNYAYIEFCGTVCPIPEYPDEYLSYMFGDWRTPHKFHKHRDVGNIYNMRIYE